MKKIKQTPAQVVPGKAEPVKTVGPKPEVMPIKTEMRPVVLEPEIPIGAASHPEAPTAGRVSFELVKPEAKRVCLAGSFNDWSPEKAPLVSRGDGRWATELRLTPGRHEYLFVVDGEWIPDPNARETVQNPFGGRNSILGVLA